MGVSGSTVHTITKFQSSGSLMAWTLVKTRLEKKIKNLIGFWVLGFVIAMSEAELTGS